MKEIWKDIIGYEGLYQVSSEGRVKSLKRKVQHSICGMKTISERILRPATDKNGYLTVDLYKDGKRKTYKVHRLVAQAFIPNPLGLPQCNHKDENPSSNYAENLEWVSAKENCNYGTRNERMAKSNLNHPSMSKPVLQLTREGELVREWPSVMEAQRLGGFKQGNISSCCSRRYGFKTHKGYVWKFKETA